jgi:transposase-like protein
MGDLPNCPACRSYDLRVLSQCDDGLTSYVCHDCNKVLHVPEAPAPERATAQASPRSHVAAATPTSRHKLR